MSIHEMWCFLLFLCCVIKVESRRLGQDVPVMVIDNDGGADDAMAIFMALLYEEHFEGPNVVGLSTVNGNVNETQAYINVQRILDIADRRNVPIYRGAKEALVINEPKDEYFGKDGLGDIDCVSYEPIKAKSIQAALALIQLSKRYEGDMILVALGPLTNVALAIKLDPGFVNRTKHIYIGGGNVYEKGFRLSTEPEFNVVLDAESYRILADNALPSKVTDVAFSQIRKYFNITTEWRKHELGVIPTKIIKALNAFERVSLPKSKIWDLLDPAVMAIALDDSIVNDVKLTENNVILCGDGKGKHQRGITLNDFNVEKGNMHLVYSASVERYKKFLLEVFSSEVNNY